MHSGEALSGTLNSIHNLAYYLGIMERVRKSLHSEGKLRFLDAGEQREQCQARGRATGLQD
jgi:queuine/archaeosine tRNA-ribosyltransferase